MDFNKLSLFKLPNRHKRFEYTPRYVDLEKEARQRQPSRQAASSEGRVALRHRTISFRGQASGRWRGNSEFKRQSMRSNLRLVVILVLTLVGVYFLFQRLDDVSLFLDSQRGE